MRTTVQIDDDLMQDLKQQACQEGAPLDELINRVLRRGARAFCKVNKPSRPYHEKTFCMGKPKVDLNRALALAASLEDDEVCEELVRQK